MSEQTNCTEEGRVEVKPDYWDADRAAFEAAMTEGGEELDYTKCGLPGIEHVYKSPRTHLLYFAWTEGRKHERATPETFPKVSPYNLPAEVRERLSGGHIARPDGVALPETQQEKP